MMDGGGRRSRRASALASLGLAVGSSRDDTVFFRKNIPGDYPRLIGGRLPFLEEICIKQIVVIHLLHNHFIFPRPLSSISEKKLSKRNWLDSNYSHFNCKSSSIQSKSKTDLYVPSKSVLVDDQYVMFLLQSVLKYLTIICCTTCLLL